MKKQRVKAKRYQRRRSRKELIKRRKRGRKKISENTKSKIIHSHLRKNPTFVEISSPLNISLRYEYANEFLKFIRVVKKMARKGFFIRFDLTNTKYIGEGGISMLLSVISDLERNGIFFDGFKPNNPTARDILEKSGFFKHMTGSVLKKNEVTKNEILKTGDGKTDQNVLVPHIHKAMETIWGEAARCPALYSGLGEMMRNSIEHAFEDSRNIIWHLGLNHVEEQNLVKFSFVDNGDGILQTYRHRDKSLFSKIVGLFRNNAEILKAAFEDGIQSRTGLSWRGKGLPTIFELYQDKIITNLVVISNDAYLDFDRNLFVKLRVSYSGTYYYWIMNQDCKKAFFPVLEDFIASIESPVRH